MKIKILLLTVLLLASFCSFSQGKKADSLLTILKTELSKESTYDLAKEKRITQLRLQFNNAKNQTFDVQYNILSQLFEEYRYYKFDSAFTYVRQLVALSEKFRKKDHTIESKLKLGSLLQHSGFYKEAFDVIGHVDTTHLSKALKNDYLGFSAWLNVGISEYDNDAYFTRIYKKQSDENFREAEINIPLNDFEKTINMAFNPDAAKNKKFTPAYFYKFLTERNLPSHIIAMAATRLSSAYTGQNRILFLTLSAINDIRSSTKETLAAFLLSQELFKLNKTADAYILIQEAARNARFFGARNHAVQIESTLPIISSKLLDDKQHERDKLLIGFLIFVIAAVILFFLLVVYRSQILRIKANETVIKQKNSELENVNGQLWESSRIKEELIGLFFKTCSSYIETLDKVTRKTQHNIKLGKYKDANTVLNDVHIEKEKDQLYDTLDTVFLTLFPNFITSFNSLLKKEDQIWPKKGEALTATLRIFALIRLGINDVETIAKILDYSVSTVYTYKARVKAKALVPTDDFEKKIMEIKFIDEL